MYKSFKKLSLKYAYLKLEKDETEEICKAAESDIRKYMEKNHPDFYDKRFPKMSDKINENSIPHQINSENNEEEQAHTKEENVVKKPKNKEIKKLYHKIAQRCHPDKAEGGDSEIFSDAAEAYSNDDIGKLIEICSQLQIEVNNLSEDSLNSFTENINKLSNVIEEKKQTVAWLWHNTSSDEEKEGLAQFLINNS
jgi:hypothetical protein